MNKKLAIDGGTPVRTEPFHPWPIYGAREEELLLEVLHSGNWGELSGSKVHQFETAFASFQQAHYGVCVPNGTLALELSLRALEIGPGDEVITTPYTFVATSTAILIVGARPVYVDIDPLTYNIDPARIEAAITSRTKAILPVHLAGRPAPMSEIMAIARKHNLFVLEDACQAWGAEWENRRVGAIGDLGTFSFQSSKNINSGEGGIVVTNNESLYEKCWSLHNVGRTRSGAWYYHENLGENLRMSEFQAAILIAQLERYPQHIPIREANARYLAEALSQVDGLLPLPNDPRVTQNARHLFIIRYQPECFGGKTLSQFLMAMEAEGIQPCSAGYVPLHQSPAVHRTMIRLFGEELATPPSLPVVEQIASQTLWLPQNFLLGTRADMDSIVDAACKIQQAWR
ncbi:MAG TPA: DegT/DnrJ/EryC1/StrS family aminotransferase [Anaerolineaceae bacterium]